MEVKVDEDTKSHLFTGIAGVHFVAARLSWLKLSAVPTTRNAKGPDLLVSNLSGSKAVSIQVKTTEDALRTRGRGSAKKAHHYEWEIGYASAQLNHKNLFFALVNLKQFEELPDIFIVPSSIIFKYFEGDDPKVYTRARYHPELDMIERYKNNWDVLQTALSED